MSFPLSWTLTDIATATGGTLSGGTARVTGISIDSRTVAPGDLFIALKGPNFDGHAYVAKALEAGAAAALVHDGSHLPDDAQGIVVADTLGAMEALGRAGRTRATARIAAVTGSVGKTGVKEAIAHVLAEQGGCHYSPGSFNNHWGVPLSLARLPKDIPHAVFEIGMNHPGEIVPLVDMVKPEVAVVTTVVGAHAEYFDSEEQIAAAKAEIFTGITPGGTAVLNMDNRHFDFLKSEAEQQGVSRIVSFGAHDRADVRALEAELHPTHSCITAELMGKRISYRLGIPGAHWINNSLAVLAAAGLLDADLDRAAASLASLSPPRRRGERHKLTLSAGEAELIDDSYNANPASVEAALSLLGQMSPTGRRIAVLGDMRELGDEADAKHAGLAPAVKKAETDLLFCHGPHMAALAATVPTATHTDTPEALAGLVIETLQPGDIILVKGSAGSRTSHIADALLKAFGLTPTGEV